jgi:hypothetical protein
MGAMQSTGKDKVMKRILIALVVVALAAAVAVVAPAPSAGADGLTATEVADLQYMREEEKLARDVYTALAAKWSEATVFARIAQSEQRHMDAVKVVLDRYGIADPAVGKAAGEFANAELQSLYDRLVAEGSGSLAAALGVGQTIEEADIADLEKAIAATANADLDRLYGNLLRASQNHLRAFTSHADGTLPARGAGQGFGPRAGQGAGPNGPVGTGTCTGDQTRQGMGPGGGFGPRGAGAGW